MNTQARKLMDMVNEVNGYNGELEGFFFYENDEDFFEIFFTEKPMELARAISYGEFKFTDEYVQFNGYGNLETKNGFELERLLLDNAEEIEEAYNELNN